MASGNPDTSSPPITSRTCSRPSSNCATCSGQTRARRKRSMTNTLLLRGHIQFSPIGQGIVVEFVCRTTPNQPRNLASEINDSTINIEVSKVSVSRHGHRSREMTIELIIERTDSVEPAHNTKVAEINKRKQPAGCWQLQDIHRIVPDTLASMRERL